jgi:phosphoribosyl 1,2-cyclic phosphodiesterase
METLATSLLIAGRYVASINLETFYSAVLEWFVFYKLRKIDAMILTHLHADAILGLDDIRQFTMKAIVQKSVPVYCSQDTFDAVKSAFPYLVQATEATGSGLVPAIEWNIVDSSFILFDELKITPLKVEHGLGKHGQAFYNWGFRIKDVAYISDMSLMSDETRQLISDCRILVIDALSNDEQNLGLVSHLSGWFWI